jgi:hypothetical protein
LRAAFKRGFTFYNSSAGMSCHAVWL